MGQGNLQNKKRVFTPVNDLNACRAKETAKASILGQVVMVAPPTRDKSVLQEIESCEKAAESVDKALAISNKLNSILYKTNL
jgi:hypothetical protein